MRVLMFGSGEMTDYTCCERFLTESCQVIGCDGGILHIQKMGIQPDYLLGDFDSAPPALVAHYQSKGVPVAQFPTKKNETDMELGLRFATETLEASDIVIFGGIGSRLDHTIANCQLLFPLLKKGIRGRLVNENTVAELIDKDTVIHGYQGELVSLLSMTPQCRGITLTGFLYPLTDYTLPFGSPIGVSNVLEAEEGRISLLDGVLMVIRTKDR